jgi:hypothetical protein
MREHSLQRLDQRARGDARRVGHVVAAAEHAVNPSLRREEPAPPREVQVRKTFHREDAQVDRRGVRQAHGDELGQQRIQGRPAFEDFLVEIGALFARETSERDEQRSILVPRLDHRRGEICAPGDRAAVYCRHVPL